MDYKTIIKNINEEDIPEIAYYAVDSYYNNDITLTDEDEYYEEVLESVIIEELKSHTMDFIKTINNLWNNYINQEDYDNNLYKLFVNEYCQKYNIYKLLQTELRVLINKV